MRKTLRELIGAGEYELAAHRLVYGVVRAKVMESPSAAAGRFVPRVPSARITTAGPREVADRG